MGEAMNYWSFFPAEDPWARMPVWGFADVVASEAEGVPEGTRIFGYLPPASHLVVRPDRSDPLDFVDESPHRAKLPAAYNRYIRVAGMPFYEEENEDQPMLLWPLYFTSFLIDDFLDDESMFGTKTAVLSSASSRTSSALAYLLSRRDGIEVVGLTSPGNVESPSRWASTTASSRTRNSPRSIGSRPSTSICRATPRCAARSRPLRGRAQAQLSRRHHASRGSGRWHGPRWPETGLLLRPGPAPQADGGLGSRRPQRAHRRGLEPLRRVDQRLATGRARLGRGRRRACLP